MINKLLGELFWDELSLRLFPVFQHRSSVKISKAHWGRNRISVHSVLLLINSPLQESNKGVEYNKSELMNYFNDNLISVKNSMIFHIESILGQEDRDCILDRESNLELVYKYWSQIYNLSCSLPGDEAASEELKKLTLELYR